MKSYSVEMLPIKPLLLLLLLLLLEADFELDRSLAKI